MKKAEIFSFSSSCLSHSSRMEGGKYKLRRRKNTTWKEGRKSGKIDDVIQIKLKYHYEQAEKWRKMMSGRWRGGGTTLNITLYPSLNVWQCRFLKYFHLHFCLTKSLNRKHWFGEGAQRSILLLLSKHKDRSETEEEFYGDTAKSGRESVFVLH